MELSGSHPHFSRDIHFEIPLISYFVYFDYVNGAFESHRHRFSPQIVGFPQAPGAFESLRHRNSHQAPEFTPAVVFGG